MHCRQLTHGNILTFLTHWIKNVSMIPWVSWWLKPSCDHVIFRVSKIWRMADFWDSKKCQLFNMKAKVSFVKQMRHISVQVKLCLQYTTHWGKGSNLKKRYLINCIKFERSIWYQLHFEKMKINKLPQTVLSFHITQMHLSNKKEPKQRQKMGVWIRETSWLSFRKG